MSIRRNHPALRKHNAPQAYVKGTVTLIGQDGKFSFPAWIHPNGLLAVVRASHDLRTKVHQSWGVYHIPTGFRILDKFKSKSAALACCGRLSMHDWDVTQDDSDKLKILFPVMRAERERRG